MATQTVTDAIVWPQSQGTGLSGETSEVDATLLSALADHDQGEYVNTDLLNGCSFINHDGTNDTVTVDSGVVYIRDDSSSTGGTRDASGNPQGESTTSSGYDFSFPDHLYVVVLPTSTTISCDSGVLNQIWVNITDVTGQNAVEIRSDSGTTTAPSDTFIKLGEANPDDSSADTRTADDASVTYRSATIDELNNTKCLFGDDNPSPSDINTALSNFDKVVLVGDHTSLSDRIEAQNSGTTLVIDSDATVKLADGASPTLVSFTGSNHAVPIYNDGVDDFHVIVRGTIDANDTNHTNASPAYIDGSTTAITGGSVEVTPSGNLIDVHSGVYIEAADNYEVPRAFTDDATNAALGCQDCTDFSVGTVRAIGAGEAIDINGGCVGVDVQTAIGDNISEEIVDINGQEDITIQSVVGVNTPDTGVRVGAADNVTIGNLVGHYASQTLLTTVGQHHNLHAHLNASSDTRTVYIRGGQADDLEGLRLTGHVEMSNGSGGDHAVRIDGDNAGNTVRSEDVHIDLDVVSANGIGLLVQGCDDVTGTVNAHDCSNQGVDIDDNCTTGHLIVDTHDNGAAWECRISGNDFEVYGFVEDTLRLEGDNNIAGPNIDSISNNGTGNAQVDSTAL